MQLRIKSHPKNSFPLSGLLLRGQSIGEWLEEIHRLDIDLDHATVYPVPGTVPNSLYGCLVVTSNENKLLAGSHLACQAIENRVFIPQYTTLYPSVSLDELNTLLPDSNYLFFPSIGCVALEKPIHWIDHLQLGPEQKIEVIRPAKSVFIPSKIDRFIIQEPPLEETLEQFEKSVLPEKKKFEEEPLSFIEKIKLKILRPFFNRNETVNGSHNSNQQGVMTSIGNWLSSLGKPGLDKLKLDYKELEDRNKKEIDKLLDLFKNDPNEALKYAIPLDDDTSREVEGATPSLFGLSERWNGFSLLGNSSNTGTGGAVIHHEHFDTLRDQYLATASKLIAEGKYEKAAFIYLKLLKDYVRAAEALSKGEMYAEAASIYLKYLNDKKTAAFCFEKGKRYKSAINLFEELEDYEKVGDLYVEFNKRKEANDYYEKVVQTHTTELNYLKAAMLIELKIGQLDRSQEILLKSWNESNHDALNCLNRYFNNYSNEELIETDLKRIYKHNVSNKNVDSFVKILINEYQRNRVSSESVRNLAYEIIAAQSIENPNMLSELKWFNPEDKLIIKDVLKFKNAQRKH